MKAMPRRLVATGALIGKRLMDVLAAFKGVRRLQEFERALKTVDDFANDREQG